MFHKGLLTIVCGPSGVGKGTVLKVLRDNNSNVRMSISATTRGPRQGEVEGQSYFYKSVAEFKRMIDSDELAEWAEYCGNYYGTPRKYIEDSIEQGYDVILEIDVVGAACVRSKYKDIVSIFILPPSFNELKERIEGRGTEAADVIAKRLDRAKKEISFINEFDYIIINDDVEKAAYEINSILKAEKFKYKRNTDILKEIGM